MIFYVQETMKKMCLSAWHVSKLAKSKFEVDGDQGDSSNRHSLGMVQANVGQKLLKCHFLRVFSRDQFLFHATFWFNSLTATWPCMVHFFNAL